jgi:SAM-dependent methyltransferase
MVTHDDADDTVAEQVWDPLLYSGSARHYLVGRAPYPAELAQVIRDELGLDGTGLLIDVGCGPGSLTVLLAPLFARTVGIDPDPDMIAVASGHARERGLDTVDWRQLTAEDLPADLTGARAVTFAQSFHWMDRSRVAAAVRTMLVPDGALVHVHATTHRGIDTDTPLPHPQPPWEQNTALVRRYLGPGRRAGGRTLPDEMPGGEDRVYREAGFLGPHRAEIPGRVLDRTISEVVSAVYSLSSSAPHLFGDRLPDFDSDLRQLLQTTADGGLFSELMRDIAVDFWPRPA